jgi:hypothetical protein
MPDPAVSTHPTLWPGAGHALLQPDSLGWLQPTPAWWGHGLARPELALVPESCAGEHALHRLLASDPLAPVPDAALAAVSDADVRANWQHWRAWRQGLQAAGTLQAWLLQQYRGGVQVPPLFLDLVTQALVQHLIESDPDLARNALAWRAGELFFRTQRVHTEHGRRLAADSLTVAELGPTQGLGDLGRLLAQAQVQATPLALSVLNKDSAPRYFTEAARADFRSSLVLDLTHELRTDVGHGVHFTLANASGGLKPLARLLSLWVRHLLGVEVDIQPNARIDDPNWRWHVGLDADSSALLNALYTGADKAPEPDDDRLARLISLFTLRFADAADMRTDVAGRSIYLGLAASTQGLLRMKPQNLLLNLPLARRS